MTKAPLHLFTIALAAATLSPIAKAESDAAVQAQLVKLTQELMDALVPGTVEPWQRIVADDAVIIDEFGRRQTKQEAVKSIRPMPSGFDGSIQIRDPQVRVHGDTAVLAGEMYEQESVFDQKLVVRYIFSNTFVRRGGEWKLLAATDVTLPTPPPVLAVEGLRIEDYPGVYRYGPGRAFTVAAEAGKLFYKTKAGGAHVALDAVAKDVFMDGGDEKNLIIFRRDASGHIAELIERRKFNDLHLKREAAEAKS
jgi:hypothetical protein